MMNQIKGSGLYDFFINILDRLKYNSVATINPIKDITLYSSSHIKCA